MPQTVFPAKLKLGDIVRVVAPSRSLGIISPQSREIAADRFAKLGLKLTFGEHVEEIDDFVSSSIQSRVSDLHAAFADASVSAVLTVIGGFNCNQLLRYLDWDLIRSNSKIFCGFSDITALNNAIYAKTGLVTYSGPHYSSFGQKLHFDYTLDYFRRCLFSADPVEIVPSPSWSDDPWYRDQDDRKLLPNPGWLAINSGTAEGRLLGANLCTFNLLQGTEYFPDLTDSVLFLEDDGESAPHHFDRDLQSVIHLPGFSSVKGLVIGRFQNESRMSADLLTRIIKTKAELNRLPVLSGVDFGHTDPKITFPIGGQVRLQVSSASSSLTLVAH